MPQQLSKCSHRHNRPAYFPESMKKLRGKQKQPDRDAKSKTTTQ